jgi:restriction endonuclease S subunit
MSYRISKFDVDKLGRYAEIFSGFAFKSERFTDNPKDVALVKGENVQQGFIDWNASKYWPATDPDSCKKFELRIGDVVLAMDRPWVTAGLKWAYIKKHDPKALLVQRVSRLRAKKGLDQTYLRCLISSRYLSEYIRPIVTGVNVPHISGKQIGGFKVPLPAKPIQQKIAAIISAYDEMIENNRQRIALLDKLAEEIYREWFVRLRCPYHERVEVIKRIPAGWSFDKASAFFGLAKGKSYAGDEITDNSEHMPFISLKSFNRGGGYREDGLKYYSGRFKDEQVVRQNDVVVALTDMTQDRAVVGRPARIPNLGKRGAVISLDAVKLVPHNINNTFLYAFMQHSGFSNFIKEFANGANVLHLKPELITKQKIIIPPKDLQDQFAWKAFPLYAQVDLLAEANQRLSTVRDRLLPHLLSGKLSVENLDIQFPPGMAEELDAEQTETAHA